MKLSFYGAAEEVTGSCHMLETERATLLIDCGLFQGGRFAEPKNEEKFPFDPRKITAILVTHAHLDHIGRLPKIIKAGFRGKIYMTPATRDLALLVLEDSVNVMRKEAKRQHHPTLFNREDVRRTISNVVTIEYSTIFHPTEGIDVVFRDAGHILGSAYVELQAEGKRFVFSGDLGNPPSPIIRFPERMPTADYLIMESTYGARIHEDFADRKFKLRRAVLETVKNKGVLIIPSFALERAQEILFELNYMHQEELIPTIPIFIDSPMAIKATEIFQRYSDLFNTEALRILKIDTDLFSFPGVKAVTSYQESQQIISVPGPKVIIAGSGMMNGGRIIDHAKNYLGLSNTTVLFVGFQAKGSLGRRLFDGAKSVRISGREISVQAKTKAIGAYSGHADRIGIVHWIGGAPQKPTTVFLVHGELEQAASLGQLLETTFKTKVIKPRSGEEYILE